MSFSRTALRSRILQHYQTTFGGDLQAYVDARLDAVIDQVLIDLLDRALYDVVQSVILADSGVQKLLQNVQTIRD